MRWILIESIIVAGGCVVDGGSSPGMLEIGINDDGTFLPLSDGDPMAVIRGTQGFDMINPCLRAAGADPTRPMVEVRASVEGRVLFALQPGDREDMVPDEVGSVLWNLKVPTEVFPCCLIGHEALVEASLRDARGRRFEGQLRVMLVAGADYSPRTCCYAGETCPAPIEPLMCE